jgi:PAS domain-containing protein
MLKLILLTAAAIFTAEALVMLFLESFGSELSLLERTVMDAALLLVCVFPTLYLLVFKEMAEQIRLRRQAEETQNSWNQSLEIMVEERTDRLQKSNEDLLVEVQERAKTAMALRTALNEARAGKQQLRAIINAVSDALVVVDNQWQVKNVNRAAESMFGAGSYDLQGKSLKDFLLPWSQSPASLDVFFQRERETQPIFLTPPGSSGDVRHPVQMRFGTELDWEGQPSTVLMFYFREDLSLQDSPTVHLNG